MIQVLHIGDVGYLRYIFLHTNVAKINRSRKTVVNITNKMFRNIQYMKIALEFKCDINCIILNVGSLSQTKGIPLPLSQQTPNAMHLHTQKNRQSVTILVLSFSYLTFCKHKLVLGLLVR